MRPLGECALIAIPFPQGAERWRDCLAENGFAEVICVQDGREALRLLERRNVDLLVADAVLPGIDGASLAERSLRMPLMVHPAILLAMLMNGKLPEGCIGIDRHPSDEAVQRALEDCELSKRNAPHTVLESARNLLKQLGMPDHCGSNYLLRAVELAWLDQRLTGSLMRRLYPMTAAHFGVTARHAQRAMAHAIDIAWQSGAIETQYSIFGDTIDARRGSPTCGETIALLADKLRWEGKL